MKIMAACAILSRKSVFVCLQVASPNRISDSECVSRQGTYQNIVLVSRWHVQQLSLVMITRRVIKFQPLRKPLADKSQ